MSLQDLSRELPSDDDLAHYITFVNAESDRGAAVMAAALVERALEDKIRDRLSAVDADTLDSWFEGLTGPFRTFAAKIALGRALDLYDDGFEEMLAVIKNVRNAFAHRSLPLDFKHPTVIDACQVLRPTNTDEAFPGRTLFATGCLSLARMLGKTSVGRAHLEAADFEAGMQ